MGRGERVGVWPAGDASPLPVGEAYRCHHAPLRVSYSEGQGGANAVAENQKSTWKRIWMY